MGFSRHLQESLFKMVKYFREYEYIYTGQKEGMDIQQTSLLTGFITALDSDIQTIVTPFGKVDFIELIGATNQELQALQNHQCTVKELYQKIGDITDYQRQSVI